MTNVDKPPQFRLNQAAVVVAAITIVLAIAAPWMRQFNANQWMLIAAVIIGISLGIATYLLLHVLPRRTAIRRGGTLLIDLPESIPESMASASQGSHLRIEAYLGVIGTTACFVFMLTINSSDNAHPLPLVQLGAAAALCLSSVFSFAKLLSPSPNPQLRENGLLIGPSLTPWDKFKTVRWSTSDPNILRIGVFGVWELKIAPEQHEQVETLLRERVPFFVFTERSGSAALPETPPEETN